MASGETPGTPARGRALVLGGGGVTGVAWEIGMLFGLAEAGLDLSSADLFVGTSAGSVVAAQVTSGAPLERLYEAQLADASGESVAHMSRAALARFLLAMAWPGDPQRARARLGRGALRAKTISEAERRSVIEQRLPSHDWPQQRLLVPAVDAESGAVNVFTKDSGISLVDAVAASCAVPLVWPPITIGGRRYMDGGVRSVANIDLAAGCERVVVIAPTTAGLRRADRASSQVRALSKAGKDVRAVIVRPDAAARAAIGSNVLDPAHRAASARAGRTQAAGEVERVRAVWA